MEHRIKAVLSHGMRWLLSSQVVIAVSACCLSLASCLLIGQPLEFHPVFAFVFFGALTAYNFAFLGSTPFRSLTDPVNPSANATGMISLCCTLFFLAFLPVATIGLSVGAGAACFFYLYRIRIANRVIQVRNIPLLKNVLLALIWSLATVLIPLSAFPEIPVGSEAVGWILIRRFLFILALAIPYDIRDFHADRAGRLQTLPVAIGVVRTKVLSLLALLCFCTTVFYNSLQSAGPPWDRVSLALYASALVTAVIILLAEPDRKKIYFSLLLDGTMILQFLLLLVAVAR